MKQIIILLILIKLIYAQDEMHDREISLYVINADSTEQITHHLDGIGIRWANNNVTSSYGNADEITLGNGDWENSIISGAYNIYYHNTEKYEMYANGLYKFWNGHSSKFFYLDFRDSNYGNYSADFSIQYNASSDNYHYWGNLNSSWVYIANGEFLPIWKINSTNNKPVTSNFSNYWTNCLQLIEQPSCENENNFVPSIVFGTHPSMSNITDYYIYRAINTNDSTNENNYVLYGKVSDTCFIFSDTSIVLDNYSDKFYYFIKAKNSGGLSSKTNIIVTNGITDWSKALSIINDNGNPRINWGPNPDMTLTHYEIYRGQSGDDTPPSSYTLRTTVSASTYTYKDEQLSIGGTQRYFYKVRAKNSNDTTYSNYSNYVKIRAAINEKTNIKTTVNNFNLNQNYPNPFNPSTEIKYSIKERGLVTLKIYDILGNVVKTLIEENKESGNYSVTFNASNFSSGIYFYELTVMNGSQPFRATRKMILMK